MDLDEVEKAHAIWKNNQEAISRTILELNQAVREGNPENVVQDRKKKVLEAMRNADEAELALNEVLERELDLYVE